MNNQLHPHYTLPGVMHYLQTEFTKNERDRIAWELERSEMKARIAQLEGENKDLHYKLMRTSSTNMGAEKSEESFKVTGSALTGLLKSKTAVQDNVKEIIYLFKSPNISTQLTSLNEKHNPVHEMQKMNLNEDSNNINAAQPPASRGIESPEMELHQADALQEAMNAEDSKTQDTNSDADTVILGADNAIESDHDDTKRRRSSSLFTSVKVAPVESLRNEIDHSKDLARISSLFQNSNDAESTAAIVKVKAFENHVISYSKHCQLNFWKIDETLKRSDKSEKSFKGMTPNVLDFYWLDAKRFLLLDDEGVKLYSVEDESPIDQFNIFKHDSLSCLGSQLSNIEDHDFRNDWFLFVSGTKIYLSEISFTTNSRITMGKSSTIDGVRKILSARFGMTEKSLIVFYSDPCELVIYSYQGTIIQKISLSKYFPYSSKEHGKPFLLLNKKNSKLLIEFGKRLIVYSFDQKKIVMDSNLESVPTSIIFRWKNDCIVLAYESGIVEIRSVKNFDFRRVRKLWLSSSGTNHENDSKAETQETASSKKYLSFDCTMINSTPIVVSGDSDGKIDLEECTYPSR